MEFFVLRQRQCQVQRRSEGRKHATAERRSVGGNGLAGFGSRSGKASLHLVNELRLESASSPSFDVPWPVPKSGRSAAAIFMAAMGNLLGASLQTQID